MKSALNALVPDWVNGSGAFVLDSVRNGVSGYFSTIARLLPSFVGALVLLAAASGTASAVPSFARQTGQPCSSCHTVVPELTPFGRRFKLGGYTLGGAESTIPPVAAMAIGSLSRTNKDQSAAPAPGFKTNNNFALDQASLFYAGKIYGDLGAFVQVTYDGVAKAWALDNTDLRYAKNTQLFGQDLILGISVNNNPTVQDVWSTTPAWGFPQFASGVAPEFSPPSAMIQESFAGQVVGATVYGFWDDSVYAEFGGYGGLDQNIQRRLGTLGDNQLIGFAPYGRVAVEKTWHSWDFELGGVAMYARTRPGWTPGFGTDNYTDLGFDAQLEYMGDVNRFIFKISDIEEMQNLNSTFAQGGSSNLNDSLNILNASATWVYRHKYALTGGYFNVSGTTDALRYGDSAIGSPAGSGLILDLSWTPFMDGGPKPFTTANIRLGLQYTHYLTMYGGTTNFDGAGHNAKDNDTIYAYMVDLF